MSKDIKKIREDSIDKLFSYFNGWVNVDRNDVAHVFDMYASEVLDKFREDIDNFQYEYDGGKSFEEDNEMEL